MKPLQIWDGLIRECPLKCVEYRYPLQQPLAFVMQTITNMTLWVGLLQISMLLSKLKSPNQGNACNSCRTILKITLVVMRVQSKSCLKYGLLFEIGFVFSNNQAAHVIQLLH